MDRSRVAEKLAEEHDKLARIVTDLRRTNDRPPAQPSEAWLEALRECFFAFRAHMIRRLALEEVAGFMREVLDRRPTLAREVEHLHNDHREILALTEQIHLSLGKVTPADTPALAEVRLRIDFLLDTVKHHTSHEETLVSFVFTQDLGGQD